MRSSRWVKPTNALAIAGLASTAALAGCSLFDTSCTRGAETPREAMRMFLHAVQKGDQEKTMQYLDTAMDSIDQEEFDALHQTLQGKDIDTFDIPDLRMGSGHIIDVTTSNGEYIGHFYTFDGSGKPERCDGVDWGINENPEPPPPGLVPNPIDSPSPEHS